MEAVREGIIVPGRGAAVMGASELAARRLPVSGRYAAASAAGPSRGFSRDYDALRNDGNNVLRNDS